MSCPVLPYLEVGPVNTKPRPSGRCYAYSRRKKHQNVTSRLHFACKRRAKSMAATLAGLFCAASARLFCACLGETGENCQSIPKPLTLPRLKQMRWQRGGGERDPAKKGSLWPLKGSQGSFRIRNAGDEAMNTPSVHAKVCPFNGAVRELCMSIFALCQ